MRFHKSSLCFLILISVFGSTKLAVAADPTAVSSNNLDPLPRDKRQIGLLNVQLACSAICGSRISATCEELCNTVGDSVLPLFAGGGLSKFLKSVLGSALNGRSSYPPRPCICPDIYLPVCGRNGKTYGNRCQARCEGVRVAMPGECMESSEESSEEFCFCPKIYDPVCGTDAQEYGNACEAECKGVGVHHKGPCVLDTDLLVGRRKSRRCSCRNHGHYPVCGPKGITYLNPCVAKCAHVHIIHDGWC